MIVAVADEVIAHSDELTELDQAVGDGDHGINMKRGFEAVRADAEATAQKPLPDVLKAIGTQLVMKVGGASGPLYGTLFLALSKEIAPDASNLAAAFASAVEAVKSRGKSKPGQKTMLDVLAPVQMALAEGGADLTARLPGVAASGADATIPMLATRGRASFLGDRSIGHMDPGARSSALIVSSVCRALEG
jgi:dihydroxyacetone kinase-like protein